MAYEPAQTGTKLLGAYFSQFQVAEYAALRIAVQPAVGIGEPYLLKTAHGLVGVKGYYYPTQVKQYILNHNTLIFN